MRLSHRALWIACIALAALWPLPPACGQKQAPVRPKPDAAATEDDAEAVPDAAAKADGKDTPLTMKDIERRRGQGMSPAEIADDVAERGRGFEVTADITQDSAAWASARPRSVPSRNHPPSRSCPAKG